MFGLTALELARIQFAFAMVFHILFPALTPLRHPEVAGRWFSFPNIVLLAPVPLLVLVAIALLLRSLRHAPHRVPFLMAAGEGYH